MAHGLGSTGIMQVNLDWITGSPLRLWLPNGMKLEMGGFGQWRTGCPSPTSAPQLTPSKQRLSEGVFGLGGNETNRVSFHIILSRSHPTTELSK